MCIIFAVYSIYSDKSNNISPLYLKQKISAEEVVANNLQERYDVVSLTFDSINKAFFICFKSRHSNTIKN
jgi:hypothetical protein